MHFFPDSMTLVSFGNLTIRYYAVLILTGALIAYYFVNREMVRMGYKSEDTDNIFIGLITCGIVCARIWYVLFSDLKAYLADPISIIEIWNGGIAIQGGLIGGALFLYFYTKKKKMDFFRLGDAILPYVLIAQACGRWGNFINKEAFGETVTEEYFAHWPSFLNFIKEGMFIGGSYREPMFFYESCLCLIGFVLILIYKKYSHPRRGELAGCYLLWYGAIRFWIEIRRTDSLMFMGLKMAMIISVIFMILGLFALRGGFAKLSKKKPVLLFDLDGTLLDTEPIIHASFLHTFQIMNPEIQLSEEELMSFMGPTLEQSFSKYFPEDKIEECVKIYREFNVTHHKEYVKPLPHTKECIEKWKQEGYRLAIVSSKKRDIIELGLECCDMKDDFELILGLGEYERTKPYPDGILLACEKLGVSHDQCIYVGDAKSDVKAAQNAGVYSVAIVPNLKREEELKSSKPNALIHDLAEMDEILNKDISFTYNER